VLGGVGGQRAATGNGGGGIAVQGEGREPGRAGRRRLAWLLLPLLLLLLLLALLAAAGAAAAVLLLPWCGECWWVRRVVDML